MEWAEAVEVAARSLMKAHAPIIPGLCRSTNDIVAATLELAVRIGAFMVPGCIRWSLPRTPAFQRVVRVSAGVARPKTG